MTVITISREFGSEGDWIAHHVAQSLGYHFVDRNFVGHIIDQYGYVEFDREYTTMPRFWERFDAQREKERETVVSMLNQVIRAVAHHGHAVILGRSGFEVLGGFADVLHVRLQAPFAVRVQRIMDQQNLSFEMAESLVKQNDKVRVGFVEEFYKVPWNSIQAFDLVINTGKIESDLASEMIVNTAKAFENHLDVDKPTVASIDVDRILSNSISDGLQCQKVHA
jgi:cytidylate kinase